jgi:PAS domain S-box-containing protein
LKNLDPAFQSQEKKSLSIDSLEPTTEQERRRGFLRYVNRGWLAFGVLTLIAIPFFPEQRTVFNFLITTTFPTYLITSLANRFWGIKPAGIIFSLLVNFTFYGLFNVLIREMGATEAFNSQISVWMLMGLAVLFAGAFVDKWAAPGLALINTVLLIATRLSLAPDADPRPSALVFWWMIALTIWLYERTLGDISQRVLAELAERKITDAYLREAETKYRTLVEKIPPIIYIAEPRQHIGVTYISPQIETLGFTQQEWIDDPELWLRQVHPQDQAKVKAVIEENANSNKPIKLEYRLISRDGSTKWFLDEVVDVLDEDGKSLFRQGYMLDITERKLAEEILHQQNEYLKLLNDMTQSILSTQDFDVMMDTLAKNIRTLLQADDSYITRWDAVKLQAFPIATTANLEPSYKEAYFPAGKRNFTMSALELGTILVAEDAKNSPYTSPDIVGQFPVESIIGIPLIAGKNKLGSVIVAYKERHRFTREEIGRAQQAGDQIALALWSTQQEFELQKRLKESDTLAKIATSLSETERIGLSNVLDLIVSSARELIPSSEQAVIHLLNSDQQTLTPAALAGYQDSIEGKNKMRLGIGIAGQVITHGKTINIADVSTDPRFIKLDVPPKFRSLMVAPVISGEQKLGTISVQSNLTNAFTQEDNKLLSALGTQAAIAIENTNLLENTQQALKETNALYRINQGLVASFDPDSVLTDAVTLLQQNFGYYYVQVYLREPGTGDFVLREGSGEIGMRLKKEKYRLKAGDGIIGHAAETGTAFFTNNVDDVVFFIRSPLILDTKSELSVPLKIGEQIFGVLDVQQVPPAQLTDRDIQLVSAVADQLAVALQKAQLHENLQNALEQEKSIRDQLLQNERLAVMGRLLATVSHELNNPLQAIQNALFLLKEEQGISEQGKQDLDIVLAESEHMAAMIERLRDTYRPTRIQDFQPTQVNSIIEDVYALISTHLRHNNVALEFHPDPHLPQILALSDQLRQVVLNLLMNAVEAMTNGGRLMVATKLLQDTDEILITVSDNGNGIDPLILPTIFDAFVTNKKRGTGLGLTITYDIIMRHQGRIKAENNDEQGTTFSVWLPANTKEGP